VRRKDTRTPRWAWLRKNRGTFDRQPTDETQDVVIEATGREGWIGWVELAVENVDELSTRLTARVINEINADIVAVIECEDRPALLAAHLAKCPATNNLGLIFTDDGGAPISRTRFSADVW
jgi:hypothetical protein